MDNILSYKTEVEKIIYENDDFIILPDFKWDLKDVSTLYLQAIVRDKSIRSLRDIRYTHLQMLKEIRRQAHIAVERWGIERGGLRLYVHYQPSYCSFLLSPIGLPFLNALADHFHVHIVQVNYTGFSGTSVGQAHLLDDIISMLEVHGEQTPGIFEKLTLSYTLGQFHGLYDSMTEAMKVQD